MAAIKTTAHDASSYLKRASTDTIKGAVKQYGLLAFLGGGLTDIDIATIATKAISDLASENTSLATLFISTIKNDSSYAAIRYVIDDYNFTNCVWINKVFSYQQIDGLPDRPDKVEKGILFPRQGAQEFVRMLNHLQCERDDQIPDHQA